MSEIHSRNLVIINFKCLSDTFSYHDRCKMSYKHLSLVSTWDAINAIDKQLIFHEKHGKTGSFVPHLDSAIQNQIHTDTTYNEHLRPNYFYFVHLMHVTSYKLCLVIWMPPFSLLLISNGCILLQSSQIRPIYRQCHLAFASQLRKLFQCK